MQQILKDTKLMMLKEKGLYDKKYYPLVLGK